MVRKILTSSEILWNVRAIEFWFLTHSGPSVYLLVVIYLHKVHGLANWKKNPRVLFQNGTTNSAKEGIRTPELL